MIGFGSIGKGTLPLIERHFDFDKSRFVVIDPDDDRRSADERGVRFIKQAVTKDNYRELLAPLLTAGGGQGFCVNLSVDTGSVDIMEPVPRTRRALCRHRGRAVARLLFRQEAPARTRARTTRCARPLLAAKRSNPGGPTAVSTCGANPGMVSWFVKQALLNLAADLEAQAFAEPTTREEWAKLAQTTRRQGHPHRRARHAARRRTPKPPRRVRQHLVGRRLRLGRPAAGRTRLGHAREVDAGERPRRTRTAASAAIYLLQPGANTRVRSWYADGAGRNTASSSRTTSRSRSPTISRVREQAASRCSTGRPATTPIIRAMTRCCRCTRCSARTARCRTTGTSSTKTRSSTASTNSACCSTATARTPIGMARSSRSRRRAQLAPYQNATGLQVTSAVLAGMVWALENPTAGIVEADEMDFRRCLEVQLPYLGPVKGYYTDWTPLEGRPGLFAGGHRHERSVAVPEYSGALTFYPREVASECAGGGQLGSRARPLSGESAPARPRNDALQRYFLRSFPAAWSAIPCRADRAACRRWAVGFDRPEAAARSCADSPTVEGLAP